MEGSIVNLDTRKKYRKIVVLCAWEDGVIYTNGKIV